MNGTEIPVAGETLLLRGERVLLWKSTLVVADPHFGKAAAFRAHGVFVPEASTLGTLQRLDAAVRALKPSRIVFLGDFLHAKEGRHPDTFRALCDWREQHKAVEMVLVRGNHDAHAGDPPADLCLTCVDAPLIDGPFAFAHRPSPVRGRYVLAGHVHPAVSLAGPGRQRARLSCFWFQKDVAILPAFGEFTGNAVVEPAAEDRVFVIADDEVIAA